MRSPRPLLANLRRLGHISRVLGRHGLSMLLGRRGFRRLARLPVVARGLPPSDLPGPERLRLALEELGGTFIKFGQMLALQPDILSLEYCNALFKLLDRVEPFPYEEVDRVVREELGAPPEELFEHFDPVPLATASIGQVHVAWRAGRKVAVKVQRPNVEIEFRRDIALMVAALRVIRGLRLWFLAWLIEPIEEFVTWSEEELDYRHEARYAEQLRRNSRDSPVQYVPRVYQRFTTRRVLVTEFLAGVTLLDYLRGVEQGDELLLARLESRGFDRTRFAANVIDNFLGDCFRHGLYHADLHPANLMILDDNVVGYLDFGITGAMSSYSRRHLVAMTLALAEGDTDALHAQFMKLSAFTADADPRALYEGLKALARVWYTEDEGHRKLQVGFTRVCRDMLTVSRQTGVLPERDIIKYIRSAIAIDGLCSRFRPEFHVGQRLAAVCASQIRQQSAASSVELHNLLSSSTASARLMIQGPGRSLRILDRLAAGDLPVHVQAPPRDDAAADARSGAVRLAAMVAVLALLMNVDGGVPVIGWNLFTAELLLVVVGLSLLLPNLVHLLRTRNPVPPI